MITKHKYPSAVKGLMMMHGDGVLYISGYNSDTQLYLCYHACDQCVALVPYSLLFHSLCVDTLFNLNRQKANRAKKLMEKRAASNEELKPDDSVLVFCWCF